MTIKNSTAKLEEGAITPDEFLRRVIYDSPDVCNSLCAFDGVASNADEVIDGLAAPLSREPSPQPFQLPATQTNAVPSPLCRVCFDKLKAIVLRPCGHFALCQECFDSMVARAYAKPGPKSEKTTKKLKIECPICRAMALVHKCETVYNV